jgi:hypothetical protein
MLAEVRTPPSEVALSIDRVEGIEGQGVRNVVLFEETNEPGGWGESIRCLADL